MLIGKVSMKTILSWNMHCHHAGFEIGSSALWLLKNSVHRYLLRYLKKYLLARNFKDVIKTKIKIRRKFYGIIFKKNMDNIFSHTYMMMN